MIMQEDNVKVLLRNVEVLSMRGDHFALNIVGKKLLLIKLS